jgi:glutamyl-tRNA synthetase
MTHTRFAPSPTGFLHLGGARTALFNWLAARIDGGTFILRIDDTDTVRSNDIYVDDIKRGMDWLGLDWDAVYRQSDRLDLYRASIDLLIADGHAIMDVDSSVRMNLSDDVRLPSWNDRVLGDVPISDNNWNYLKTMVIARAGYMPLYNLTTIVDDLDLGVNSIIRGVDHTNNTALQHTLKTLINPSYDLKYAHVGLIHGANGKKMSKRDGDDSFLLKHYIDADYLPAAMFNCLLRLGWGPKIDNKTTSKITRDDAFRLFVDGGNLLASPSKFDLVKLDSWNKKFSYTRV